MDVLKVAAEMRNMEIRNTIAVYVKAIRDSHRVIKGWWWVLPLAWFVGPSRYWPKNGIRRLRDYQILVTLNTGAQFVCLLSEVYTIIEVYCRKEYETCLEKADHIVDIGSNIGVSVVWFGHKYPTAAIWAIEPTYLTMKRLITNLHINGMSGRVDVMSVAVGGKDGFAKLKLGLTSAVASASRDDSPGLSVSTISLASIIERVGGTVDLVKIDCEGAEYEFFQEAPDDVISEIGLVVGEAHSVGSPQHEQLMLRFRNLGFHVSEYNRNGQYETFQAVNNRLHENLI